MISRDVRFDEKASYDFSDFSSSSNCQILDFEENESQPSQHDVDQKNESPQNLPSTAGKKTRSLREIYEQTEKVNGANPLFFACEDPITYEEASKEEKWVQDMNEEINAIEKNGTWELTVLPLHKSSIWCKMGVQNKGQSRWFHQQIQSNIGCKGIQAKRK